MELKFERRAKLRISVLLLKQLLKIPDDISIVGTDYDPNHDCVQIYLKGTNKSLYKVAEGGVSPAIIAFNDER